MSALRNEDCGSGVHARVKEGVRPSGEGVRSTIAMRLCGVIGTLLALDIVPSERDPHTTGTSLWMDVTYQGSRQANKARRAEVSSWYSSCQPAAGVDPPGVGIELPLTQPVPLSELYRVQAQNDVPPFKVYEVRMR